MPAGYKPPGASVPTRHLSGVRDDRDPGRLLYKSSVFFTSRRIRALGMDGAVTPAMATTIFTGRRRHGGYSLLELMTVVGVVAIAAALAYPSLAELRRGQELESAAVGLTQRLRLAHWRSIVTGTRVRVAPQQGPDGAWEFIVEREQGEGWIPDGDEQKIPRGTVVAIAGVNEKVFNPDGTCSLGSITLRGPGGEVYKCTLASATGRVRFYRGDREAGRGL